MGDITRTKAQVSPVHPRQAEIYDAIAAVSIEAGQAVYINSNGKVDLSDADASATTEVFRGIALKSVAAGQSTSVLVRGTVTGYDLSGVAYGAAVYVSNTTGELSTSAGSTSLIAGYCLPLTDPVMTKCLFVVGYAG